MRTSIVKSSPKFSLTSNLRISLLLLLIISLTVSALTPSNSASDSIQPYIINPSGGANVYSNINISATELTNPDAVTSATFEYSADGLDWMFIGTDTNGTIEAKATDRVSYQKDIWTAYWVIDSLSEGWYYLRVTMINSTLHTGQHQVQVYVDPTPPIPIFVKPTLTDGLFVTVSGTATFEITTADENVVSLTLEYIPIPTYYNKTIPKKNQHDYGPLKGQPKGSQAWKDDASCGPTSAGSSFWYFAKKYPEKYGDLIKEGGKTLNQTELIDKLHKYAKVVERSPKIGGEGVSDPNMKKGLEGWIKDHGGCLTVEYVNRTSFTFKKYATELLASEDLMVSTDAHWMAGNSVNLTKNADGTHNVDFMDPWTGEYINVKMHKNGNFTVYGRPKDTMFVISPCPNMTVVPWILIDYIPIGYDMVDAHEIDAVVDSDGFVGWNVVWDTSGLTPSSWYLLKAAMTDANGRNGTEKILVYLAPPVGGEVTPIDSPALLAPYLALVSVAVATIAAAAYISRLRSKPSEPRKLTEQRHP